MICYVVSLTAMCHVFMLFVVITDKLPLKSCWIQIIDALENSQTWPFSSRCLSSAESHLSHIGHIRSCCIVLLRTSSQYFQHWNYVFSCSIYVVYSVGLYFCSMRNYTPTQAQQKLWISTMQHNIRVLEVNNALILSLEKLELFNNNWAVHSHEALWMKSSSFYCHESLYIYRCISIK